MSEQHGTAYLVMQYLEGETLADRLVKGPMPLDQALVIGIEIADALDRAHRAGIIHRDLKPGNVILTKAGAKLLDFGLAKAHAPGDCWNCGIDAADDAADHAAGFDSRDVPIHGSRADRRRRSGCPHRYLRVWRRALRNGHRPKGLSGQEPGECARRDSERPPPLSTVQPLTPPALDRLVRKCLAKDRDDRWQTVRDLLDELRWVAERGSTSDVTASVVSRRRSPEWSAWTTAAVLGAIAVGAGALAVVHVRERSTPVEPVVFTIAAAENSVLVTPPEFAISPDGRQVVFLASASQGLAMLWVRPLATLAARALPGTERASQPFWSPDSRSVGFFADGKLKKVDVGGGSPTVLCDSASGLFGGTWSRNNIIVFAPSGGSPLLKVDAAGGMSKPMTTLDKDVISQRYPSFLSDGDHVIYLELRAAARELRVASLGSTDTTSIGAFIVARDRAGGFVDCSRKRRCGCEKARAAVGHQLQ